MRLGLQKLTLLDYPGVMACTIFTCGCNFRCPFCHNASLVTGNANALPYTPGELIEFLDGRKRMLDGVCITGGEPLLHPAIPQLIRDIKKMGYKVKLDTNGSRPEILAELLQSGAVDYVAMDIKHAKEKYAQASGTDEFLEQVCRSVELLNASPVEHEFRTTVVAGLHTPDDTEEIARWISGAEHYYLQNFTDSGDILDRERIFSAVEKPVLEEMLRRAQLFIPAAAIRGK